MSLSKPDAALIERILQNDRNAQFQLFEMTKGMLYSTCYRILSHEEKAHDIFLDVYVEILSVLLQRKSNNTAKIVLCSSFLPGAHTPIYKNFTLPGFLGFIKFHSQY